MVTTELKNRIIDAIRDRRKQYTADSKMAAVIGISSAIYSRLMKGEVDGVLADAKWITIARKLEVTMGNVVEMITARTPVYNKITAQLEACQKTSISALLCDMAGIGKTHAAKQYVKSAKHAVYIDCSQVKSKQKLIRQIAKEFGLESKGRYSEIYEDLVYYVKSIPCPLVILDEAGDLDYSAMLELKALWNATEHCCGWYMMGADGLKAKIDRNLQCKKVGYAELFRRYGERYQKISPEGKEETEEFRRSQLSIVAQANGITDIQAMYAKTGGSLSRLYIEIQKQRQQEQQQQQLQQTA